MPLILFFYASQMWISEQQMCFPCVSELLIVWGNFMKKGLYWSARGLVRW